MLVLVLSLNHFEFNETFWAQKEGVAMGNKCSPALSNLSLEDIEKKFVYTYKLQPLLWNASLMTFSSSELTPEKK